VLLPQEHVEMTAISFSPDGALSASGHVDGTVTIWEVRTGRQLTTIHAHLGNTNKVAFTPDGTRLLTLGDPKMLKLWDIRALLEQVAPEEADVEEQ
jgi:WD40 repeat protein